MFSSFLTAHSCLYLKKKKKKYCRLSFSGSAIVPSSPHSPAGMTKACFDCFVSRPVRRLSTARKTRLLKVFKRIVRTVQKSRHHKCLSYIYIYCSIVRPTTRFGRVLTTLANMILGENSRPKKKILFPSRKRINKTKNKESSIFYINPVPCDGYD